MKKWIRGSIMAILLCCTGCGHTQVRDTRLELEVGRGFLLGPVDIIKGPVTEPETGAVFYLVRKKGDAWGDQSHRSSQPRRGSW